MFLGTVASQLKGKFYRLYSMRLHFFLAYISCFLAIAFSGCHQEAPPHAQQAVSVTTMTIEPHTIPADFEYVGVAQSSHLVEIRARVEGYLEEIAYREGELVQQGDLLFRIDPKPFEAVVAQAKALQQQQQALWWEAQRTLERLKPLYEQKAASRRDLDNATAEEQRASAAVDSAKAQVLQAEINLGYTTIRSPIKGVTSSANYRVGALVGPGQQSLLATVTAMDPIWVNFSVSENDILKFRSQIAEGLLQFPKDMNFDIEIILANGNTYPVTGKVDFADPTLQQETGSMSVRAKIPNPDHLLRPGQFVRARVKGAIRVDALTVPQRAVVQGKDGLYVYVVDKNGEAHINYVKAGDWYEDSWIITSGLHAGDQVIIDGVNKVMPGMHVKT